MKVCLVCVAWCLTWLVRAQIPGSCQTLLNPDLKSELVISATQQGNLRYPTQFAFIAPDEVLVCEKLSGRVKHYKNGTFQSIALDLPVRYNDEFGLLGIAIDPSFAENGYVYLFWSNADVDGGTWIDNRIARFRWNGMALIEQSAPIFLVPKDSTQENGPNHQGGIITFGPDGKLYGATGDMNRGRFSPRIEQNTSETAVAGTGGIFRIDPDGSIPPDNPFASDPRPQIQRLLTYGLRNSYGICFDSQTGKLWYTDNGPVLYDEVNLATPGANGGWLKIMGPDSRDATYAENNFTPYNASDLVYLPGATYTDPLFSWLNPIGVTGIVFLESPKWPASLRGKAVLGESNYTHLYLLSLNEARDDFVLSGGAADRVADSDSERDENLWGYGYFLTTDMEIGPDGYLYVLTWNDEGALYRIRPIWTDTPPDAVAVSQGTHLSGGLPELAASDNLYYRVGSLVNPSQLGKPVVTEAQISASFAQANISRLDLDVESRNNVAGTKQELRLYDVVNQRWVTVDSRDAQVTDTLVTLRTIANPQNYVDSIAKTCLLRIQNFSGNRFALFQTSIDYVNFKPVYP